MAFRFSLGFGGASFGKELQDWVVHREQPLIHRQADAGGGEALAQRVLRVRGLGPVGRPPPLGGHVTVAQKHEAVHRVQRVVVLLDRPNEVQNRRRGDALGFRVAALQLSYACHDIDLLLIHTAGIGERNSSAFCPSSTCKMPFARCCFFRSLPINLRNQRSAFAKGWRALPK